MEKGLQAALRRFPHRGQEIWRLALTNSTFRSLCDDFADAEAALDLWAVSNAIHSAQRRSEYQILTDELAAEVEHTLDAHLGETHFPRGL